VLVLIQVAALRAARQAHALQQFDRRNDNNAPTDARSPLSRLAILRIFPVGADIDFRRPIAPMISSLTLSNDLIVTFLSHLVYFLFSHVFFENY
jgi:hypothetical protein